MRVMKSPSNPVSSNSASSAPRTAPPSNSDTAACFIYQPGSKHSCVCVCVCKCLLERMKPWRHGNHIATKADNISRCWIVMRGPTSALQAFQLIYLDSFSQLDSSSIQMCLYHCAHLKTQSCWLFATGSRCTDAASEPLWIKEYSPSIKSAWGDRRYIKRTVPSDQSQECYQGVSWAMIREEP